MRVEPKDLLQAFQGNGHAFEDFVHDLVREVGRSCGIDPVTIDWDHRPSVKDGGRDVVVRVPNTRPDKLFIPNRPSLWSIKSGADGISPASLAQEILSKNHPKVREDLRNGRVYVWCTIHPATHDQREAMRTKAKEVADELKVDPSLIDFRWDDHLEGELNLHPYLIPVHLPDFTFLLPVLSLKQWRRQLELVDGWVGFGGRDDVVTRIGAHLLSSEPPNVLHMIGLSGIGKTRTVYEACRRTPELNGVFYIPEGEQVTSRLYHYLEQPGRRVYLVIDETRSEQQDKIRAQLSEFADRVRVVTIGPAVRQPAIDTGETLVLREPETDTEVLQVVRAAGVGLADDVLHSIAEQSGHDLRLALLLVRASRELPEFQHVPLSRIDDVWYRLMRLFRDKVGSPDLFRERYEVLTVSMDVGMTDDVGGEIQLLADYFQHPVEHVRAAAHAAGGCGLGFITRSGRFFEATPRALAAYVFQSRVWPRLQDRLDEFASALLAHSQRLAQRFLDRCQDCTGNVREEVQARLGKFFLGALAEGDVTALASRAASRVFQTWAEFDPARGLNWLENAVNRASAEQLLALDGRQDISGGWRGRRQLVWLCQNLASFAEYFEACEAILFRLALHETERDIGNNSTAIWESLFWPALAGTDVPFERRLPILVRRLQRATPEELPLLLGAAVGCIEHRRVGLPAPPRVVGGRVVPPPWRPATWGELGRLRRDAARQILDTVDGFPDDLAQIALAVLVEHLQVFRGLGELSRLRALFRPDRLNDSLRRHLVAQLEKHIAFIREINQEGGTKPPLQPLEEWLAELSPRDLATRVRDLTAQRYWSPGTREDRQARYDALGAELIASPETLRGLADWFAAPEVMSADFLGISIGRQDKDRRLAPVVQGWLKGGRCNSVTVGYLTGVAARGGALPDDWASFLDALAADQPEPTSLATLSADVSERGLERLLGLLGRLPAPASRYLLQLGFGAWLRVVGASQRVRIATALIRLADEGDPGAVHVALDIIGMWAHVDPKAISDEMAALALNLASRPLPDGRRGDNHLWLKVLEVLCPFYPREVAEVMLARITDPASSFVWRDEESVAVLVRAAEREPVAVMEEIGKVLLDRERRAIFGVSNFDGLFEAVGMQHVQAWLEQHGQEYLRWMARHFRRPYLDEAGRPVVPALTEWLFREHEDDDEAFRWFLMGSHSGEVRSESQVNPERKKLEMQPYLAHELRRVREWAQSEIREEVRFDEWFKEMDEEQDRR